jgi:4-hydroxy-tetrahydrodipicolinate synthase
MSAFTPRGTYTALVTPFTSDGTAIDWDAYEKHLGEQAAGGVTGVVPCGTTGETPTLTDSEQALLIQRTVSLARGRMRVLAGTGSNSTKKTIEASRAALEAGAHAVMIVMPYYNKPSQAGLLRHVEAVAEAVDGPIVLYNVPGRTGVDLQVETLGAAAQKCPNVVAIKDASNNVHFCQAVTASDSRIAVFSGDDALTVPLMSVGAVGVISVTSNVYPKEVTAVVDDMLAGRWDSAKKRHLRLLPVHHAMFWEPNPSPAKAALAARGRMHDSVRAPLYPVSAETRARLVATLDAFEHR